MGNSNDPFKLGSDSYSGHEYSYDKSWTSSSVTVNTPSWISGIYEPPKPPTLADDFVGKVRDTMLLEMLITLYKARKHLTNDTRKVIEELVDNDGYLGKLVDAAVEPDIQD